MSKEVNNKTALKSGIWYTVSNFIVRSIGFITTPIFTRLLTKAEFGMFNNYSSWLVIITIFVTLNLESTLISARYDYEENLDEYILSVLALSSFSALTWIVLSNFFFTFVNSITSLDRIYINVMLVYLFFLPAVNLFQVRERYLFEYKKTVLISCIISIGTAFLSVFLVWAMSDGLLGRVIGATVPTIAVGVFLYGFFIVKGRRVRIKYWFYAIAVCWPYIPHLLSNNLLNSMDRIMINSYCGSEATALYSLAYSCGAIVTMLVVSVNSAYSPWLAAKLKSGFHTEILAFSKRYISIFMSLAFFIMLVAPEVLLILGGETYIEAKFVLPPVAMGCTCQFLYTMLVNVEQFYKKTVGMACATVIAAIANYILNFIFIPRYGYIAAAYTSLAGYLLLLMSHMLLVHKLGMSDIYDYKYIGKCVVLGIIATIMINVFYYFDIIRYFIILTYLFFLVGVLWRNRDMVKQIRG